VRLAIRAGMGDAEEVISYQIPAYRLNGHRFYFAGYKKHYSVYCDEMGALLDAFGDELAGCELSKGTIKFPLTEPVPSELITRMARHQAERYRAADVEAQKG